MPPSSESIPESISLEEPLGLKHPLTPMKALGQNWLSPKFLTPLGANSLTVIDPTIFSAEAASGYEPVGEAFEELPFFSNSRGKRTDKNTIKDAGTEPTKSRSLQRLSTPQLPNTETPPVHRRAEPTALEVTKADPTAAIAPAIPLPVVDLPTDTAATTNHPALSSEAAGLDSIVVPSNLTIPASNPNPSALNSNPLLPDSTIPASNLTIPVSNSNPSALNSEAAVSDPTVAPTHTNHSPAFLKPEDLKPSAAPPKAQDHRETITPATSVNRIHAVDAAASVTPVQLQSEQADMTQGQIAALETSVTPVQLRSGQVHPHVAQPKVAPQPDSEAVESPISPSIEVGEATKNRRTAPPTPSGLPQLPPKLPNFEEQSLSEWEVLDECESFPELASGGVSENLQPNPGETSESNLPQSPPSQSKVPIAAPEVETRNRSLDAVKLSLPSAHPILPKPAAPALPTVQTQPERDSDSQFPDQPSISDPPLVTAIENLEATHQVSEPSAEVSEPSAKVSAPQSLTQPATSDAPSITDVRNLGVAREVSKTQSHRKDSVSTADFGTEIGDLGSNPTHLPSSTFNSESSVASINQDGVPLAVIPPLQRQPSIDLIPPAQVTESTDSIAPSQVLPQSATPGSALTADSLSPPPASNLLRNRSLDPIPGGSDRQSSSELGDLGNAPSPHAEAPRLSAPPLQSQPTAEASPEVSVVLAPTSNPRADLSIPAPIAIAPPQVSEVERVGDAETPSHPLNSAQVSSSPTAPIVQARLESSTESSVTPPPPDLDRITANQLAFTTALPDDPSHAVDDSLSDSTASPAVSSETPDFQTSLPQLPTVLANLSTLKPLGTSQSLQALRAPDSLHVEAAKLDFPQASTETDSATPTHHASSNSVQKSTSFNSEALAHWQAPGEFVTPDRSPPAFPAIQTKSEPASGTTIAPAKSQPRVKVPPIHADYELPSLSDRGFQPSLAEPTPLAALDSLGDAQPGATPDTWSSLEELLHQSHAPRHPSVLQRVTDPHTTPELSANNLFSLDDSVVPDLNSSSVNGTVQRQVPSNESAVSSSPPAAQSSLEPEQAVAQGEEQRGGRSQPDSDSLELLAREIYNQLRQRLEIERERQGYYSNRWSS